MTGPQPDIAVQPSAAPPPLGRPFFIFGAARSGTSLLSRMLDAHPNIAIPYESHLYSRVYPVVHGRCDLSDPRTRTRLVAEILRTDPVTMWQPAPSLTETLAAITRPDFHGVFEGLLGAWARQRGKSRWGEKSPVHTLCWRAILEGFPDLQVLHLVRDGRDVALSYRAAPFGPKHVYQLAHRWVLYLRVAEKAQAALGPGAFLQVRYEDLVSSPEPELRRICDFLGEEYTPTMLTFYQGNGDYPTDPRNIANLRRPPLADNIGKWRTRMTGRDLRIYEAIAGSYLERYGYPRTLADPQISAWEAWSCRHLEHPPLRALAMLRNYEAVGRALQRLRLQALLRLRL
jgi:Sulfotransferase family